jgi:hypothetical protein
MLSLFEIKGGAAGFGLLNEPLTPALSPPRGEGEEAAVVLVFHGGLFQVALPDGVR